MCHTIFFTRINVIPSCILFPISLTIANGIYRSQSPLKFRNNRDYMFIQRISKQHLLYNKINHHSLPKVAHAHTCMFFSTPELYIRSKH